VFELKDQTACGNPTLTDGYASVHTPSSLVLRNPEIVVLSSTGYTWSELRKYENRARVHFIPHRMCGLFVTLRAPDAISSPVPYDHVFSRFSSR